MARIVLNLSKH